MSEEEDVIAATGKPADAEKFIGPPYRTCDCGERVSFGDLHECEPADAEMGTCHDCRSGHSCAFPERETGWPCDGWEGKFPDAEMGKACEIQALEDETCAKCHQSVSTPYGLEPTPYCNTCAQEIVVAQQAIIDRQAGEIRHWQTQAQNYEEVAECQAERLKAKDEAIEAALRIKVLWLPPSSSDGKPNIKDECRALARMAVRLEQALKGSDDERKRQ